MNIARKLSQKYFSRFAFARAARNSAQHIFWTWSMANASIISAANTVARFFSPWPKLCSNS